MLSREDGQVELCCPPEIEAALFDQSNGVDVLDYAERVQAPTLIVCARGGYFPPALFEILAEALPRAQLVHSPAGHLLPMEDPKGVAEILLRFCDTPP